MLHVEQSECYTVSGNYLHIRVERKTCRDCMSTHPKGFLPGCFSDGIGVSFFEDIELISHVLCP